MKKPMLPLFLTMFISLHTGTIYCAPDKQDNTAGKSVIDLGEIEIRCTIGDGFILSEFFLAFMSRCVTLNELEQQNNQRRFFGIKKWQCARLIKQEKAKTEQLRKLCQNNLSAAATENYRSFQEFLLKYNKLNEKK